MYESVSGLKSSPIKNNLSIKMIFIGTEEVHYLKSDLISKINFVQTKEKRYNPALLLQERRLMFAQSLLVILLVNNSESIEVDLDQLCKLKY